MSAVSTARASPTPAARHEAGDGVAPAGEFRHHGVDGREDEVHSVAAKKRLEARPETGLAKRRTFEVALDEHARGVVGAIEAAPGEELDLVAFRQRLEDLQPRLVRRGEDEHAYAHRRSSRTFTVSRTK